MMNRRQFVAATAVAFAPLGVSTSIGAEQRWEPDGVGSLARIGVLTPDDDPVPESEMWAMAPPGVSIHGSPVVWNGGRRAFAEPPYVDDATDRLVALAPRAILYAFTSSSYVLGAGADNSVRERLEKRSGGIPVIHTCAAATEALRLLGAHRVALIHPPWFPEALNTKGKDYFQARGLDVLSSMSIAPARKFQEVPPAEVYEWTVAHVPREADAVFIGGNGLRAIGTIHALEQRLQKPVLTANQVLFRQTLRDLGVNIRSTRYGSLFADATTRRLR